MEDGSAKIAQVEQSEQNIKIKKDSARIERIPKEIRSPGRGKGTKNKFTDLKTAFLNAFQDVGGEAYLREFALQKQNRAAFLQMIAKMLPNKVEADIDVSGRVQIVEIPAKLPRGDADGTK